ncbi:RNA polymerase sigma factor [Aureliella helgolandensis]|uniref:RNA polymerase sigma factor n=1 Tax=Aureliella helgolandensis TaxID=2527968 RepID=A0A518GAZ6_9BACT|nr:RNA polymerase sigma factor [Aureliella helgolandensis]QDV25733.1 RNA polymerase sigma factor [Aureliella helgolandensis]
MNAIEFDKLYRDSSRKVFATLVRLLGDFDMAEEAMHEAFAAALEQWSNQGMPANPTSWLVSTGRFKAIDSMRRRARLRDLQPEVALRLSEIEAANHSLAEHDIQDDRLRLIFTCCHPAIAPKVQIPLTLREVCGMTTEEIARAFLMAPSTLAQRIVRGKAKIRDARIPFVIPSLADLPARLDSVLTVIYLVFNEGYSASSGASLIRTDLSDEAIRLNRLLLELLPDPEVLGLLALMLLHESRREARLDQDHNIVLLEEQNRQLWKQELIGEGKQLIDQALRSRRFGVYTIQAAISAVHSDAQVAAETDWPQIVALYDILLRAEPSPIVELNRAVAIAMRDGPAAGLAIIDKILKRGELREYSLAHAARGELLRRVGQPADAKIAFEQALKLAQQETEQRFLRQKITLLTSN